MRGGERATVLGGVPSSTRSGRLARRLADLPDQRRLAASGGAQHLAASAPAANVLEVRRAAALRAVATHRKVAQLERLLEDAKTERAIAFALANELGQSSGDIARLLPPNVLPHNVHPIVRVGRGLLAARRRRATGGS